MNHVRSFNQLIMEVSGQVEDGYNIENENSAVEKYQS
jgi:hypothetical protein